MRFPLHHGLEHAAHQAEHFALLGRLAAGVSREIRNPLGAIVLHVDLLTEELQELLPHGPAVVAETLAEIKTADYALTPGRYVGAAQVADDGEPIDEKIARLKTELLAAFDESARLETAVREQLERIGG